MKVTEKYVFFWKESLSQWTKTLFTINGMTFNCAEQYMMWSKAILFGDTDTAQKILATSSPREQKVLGREVKNFKYDIWATNAKKIVYNGNKAKFLQNTDILKELMRYGDRKFVEASPVDYIWGIGMDENDYNLIDESLWGNNWLGEVLTELRNDITSVQTPIDMVMFANNYKPVDEYKEPAPVQLPVGTVVSINNNYMLGIISESTEYSYKFIDSDGDEEDCEDNIIFDASHMKTNLLENLLEESENLIKDNLENLYYAFDEILDPKKKRVYKLLGIEINKEILIEEVVRQINESYNEN